MDNVGVSEEGIPYIHYLPEKTKGTQKDNSETITPLVRYAFDIIKRTQLNLPILKYPSGKSGYNKKIKQLLKNAGLHRQGSGAVTHYTMLELADRFKLMNLAFDQEDYRVDKNLEVIDNPMKKDC